MAAKNNYENISVTISRNLNLNEIIRARRDEKLEIINYGKALFSTRLTAVLSDNHNPVPVNITSNGPAIGDLTCIFNYKWNTKIYIKNNYHTGDM